MKKINLKEIYDKINNKFSSFLNKNIIRFNNIKQFFKEKQNNIKNISNIKNLFKDTKQKIKLFFKNIFKTPKNTIKKEENELSIDDKTKQFKKKLADEVSEMLKQKNAEKNLNNNTNKDINTNTNSINTNTNTNSISIKVNISNIEHYTRLVDEQVKKLKQQGMTIEEIAKYLSPTAKEEFIKREELIQKNRERKEYLNNKYGTALEGLTTNINKSIEIKQKLEPVIQNTVPVLDDEEVESMGVINNFDVNNVIDVDDYVVINNKEENISKNKVKKIKL